VSADIEQIDFMVKCMQQDCAQSMEGGNANQKDNLGCRFLDPNGFCYMYGTLQLWCATSGAGNKWCNDGGADWAQPPLGTAAPGKEQWTPKSNIHIWTKTASNVPVIDTTKPTYSCACMKKCSCTYKKPTATGEIQSRCFCKNPKGGELFGDQTEMQIYKDIIAAGKISSADKSEECDCVCSGRMDT
jgi:hypothetical protein